MFKNEIFKYELIGEAIMDRKSSINFSRDLLETYNVWCKPLCKEIQMPKTAFDILMFLANNPDYNTARDIVEIRGLKANLVSVNVDKLVNEGFLERIPDTKDRRKNMLKCTNKANAMVNKTLLCVCIVRITNTILLTYFFSQKK